MDAMLRCEDFIVGFSSLSNKEKRSKRLELANKKGTHNKSDWEALKEKFDFRCVRCGISSYHLDKDHIIPIYAGGSNGIDNIQPLCAKCNSSKGPEDINWAKYRIKYGFVEVSYETI